VALGLPDTVLGAAWPAMHGDFGVSLGALGVLGVTGALAAVASSVGYGWLKTKPPPWVVLVGSVALMAASMLAFGLTNTWWVAIALCVAWGLCGGGIDIQLNHFAAKHFSPRHMNWLHGCWGIGAATGPLLVAGALAWTGHWRAGFWMLAATMAALGLAFWLTRGLWPAPESPAAQPLDAAADVPSIADLQSPAAAVWLSPVCFFLVVAAEFATAIWVPSIMADGHGLSAADASRWATLFFGAMMVGRFAIGAFSESVGNRRLVRLGIVAAMVGAALFQACGATAWGAAGLAVMGLGSAPLFPGLMHETMVRFSAAWAQRMVARQMTGAYLAGALMPLAYALLVDRLGVRAIIPTAIALQLLLLLCTVALDRATPPPSSPSPDARH
jgi:fucose permease